MKLIFIAIILLLAACTPKPIYVPVAPRCPGVNLPSEQRYPIKDLVAQSKPNEAIKAYVISLKMCVADNEHLRKICEPK